MSKQCCLLFVYQWLESCRFKCHRLVRRAPALIRVTLVHTGQWCKKRAILSQQGVRGSTGYEGKTPFSLIRVGVTPLHQLTAFIVKLSRCWSELSLTVDTKKTHLCGSSGLAFRAYGLLVWTVGLWPTVSEAVTLPAADPQVQHSRLCRWGTGVLCLVGHWSSPPLWGPHCFSI